MDDITIVPLENNHLEQASNWANQDTAPRLFRAASGSMPQDATGWTALRSDEPVAVLILLSGRGKTHIEFLVKPSERRQGIGTRILRYVLEQPSVGSLRGLHASVELDNTAAQKLLVREGFSRIGYTEDGRLEYERH